MNQPFFNRWVFLVALLACCFVALFWREMTEGAADGMGRLLTVDNDPFYAKDDDFRGAFRVILEPEKNNIKMVSLTGLKVLRRQSGSATVEMTLSTRNRGDDYPSIRIYYLDAGRRVVRTQDLAPSEYDHGFNLLDEERVTVTLQLKRGEESFTAKPFYKGGEPKP